MEIIEHPPILHVPAVPDHILYTWIVMAILAVVAIVATRRRSWIWAAPHPSLMCLKSFFI